MADITVHSTNIENIELGPLTARYSARGDRVLRYAVSIVHKRLNLHKEVSAPEIFMLQAKLDTLTAAWDEKYAQYQLRQLLRSGQESADEETATAQVRLESLRTILARTLKVNDEVDWESLKDRSTYQMPAAFPEPCPRLQNAPAPVYEQPKVGFLDLILGRRASIEAAAGAAHAERMALWEAQEASRREQHIKAEAAWKKRERAFWVEHRRAEAAFAAEQGARNAEIDKLRDAVAQGVPDAVIEHATLVLDASDYEGLFEKSFTIQYRPFDRLLMVEYDLPGPDDLPVVQSVKFVKSTGEMKERLISERDQKANFESVAYQVCLRTLHELFESDMSGNLKQILFNGCVNFVDRRTGQDARACLLSVLVERQAFMAIDLGRIDPKTCFKSLKGVSAAALSSLTPVPPVMNMDREDRRFIEGRDVADNIEVGTNLATISWEDFEHLIRELFESEFRSRGGEVKVTQASRDGGVDAVAFDPDPISGGKIVIQAKRYTRTVGVSAVRDLYGTVLNEGASKGILVTTADFGPDAYQFANGKPLTLLSGSNLLHLLARHGHSARIDLVEARELRMKA